MSTPLEPRTWNLEPGDSVTPPCPHFGRCGGCQLQNIAYPAQLAAKAAQLNALFSATGLALPELQLHASPPLAYRNRIRLTLGEVAGKLRAGYLRRAIDPDTGCPTSGLSDVGSTDAGDFSPSTARSAPTFLPITECPIAAPILWRTAEAIVAELNQRAAVWTERAPFTLDQLELFTTADETSLQLSLFVRTSARTLPARFTTELAALCEAIRGQIPALTGAGIYLLPARSARSRRIEQPRPGPAWGTPGLNYSVPTHSEAVDPDAIRNLSSPSLPPSVSQLTTYNLQLTTVFWVPRGAFFQINRFLLPELVAIVTANREGNLAWDLYAGVGLFTRALAPHFTRITAVEIAEPAFTALASAKLPNRHAVKETTLDFLRSAVTQRERPDLIVLDPPRTGAGPEICALLGRIAAPTVIYVSCSPETLPADLTTLAASGYRIAELHLLDLFPQTTHIETVAILTRGPGEPA